MNPFKYIRTFFYPTVLTYSYNKPKESVIAKLEEAFARKATFFSSNDMTGTFLMDGSFAIDVISPAFTRGIKFSSTLNGQVLEPKIGATQIKTKAKPSNALYFLFFGSIVFGLVYLCRFILSGSTELLLWSLAMLIMGPALAISVSNAFIASINDRYRIYIDKELM